MYQAKKVLTASDNQAIFFQRSKSLQSEFALITLVTVREEIKSKLEKIISDANMQLRPLDQACILETLTLINQMRDATFNLVDAVKVWQQGFTSNIRPQLMQCDYLIAMISSMIFVSSSGLRRLFNFQFGVGWNFLMLPCPNPRTKDAIKISPDLAKQILLFARPAEHRLINCYQILLNCLPEKAFRKIIAIEDWLDNAWVPRVWIVDPATLNPDGSTVIVKKKASPKKVKSENSEDNNNDNNNFGTNAGGSGPVIARRGNLSAADAKNIPGRTNLDKTTPDNEPQKSAGAVSFSLDFAIDEDNEEEKESSAAAAKAVPQPFIPRQRRAVNTIVVGGQRTAGGGEKMDKATALERLKNLSTSQKGSEGGVGEAAMTATLGHEIAAKHARILTPSSSSSNGINYRKDGAMASSSSSATAPALKGGGAKSPQTAAAHPLSHSASLASASLAESSASTSRPKSNGGDDKPLVFASVEERAQKMSINTQLFREWMVNPEES